MAEYKLIRTKKLFKPGVKFEFSRTKVEEYLNCKRCFYLDRKLGLEKPQSLPLSINSAIDTLLKREFDRFRLNQTIHPLILQNNLSLVPFKHLEFEKWRNNRNGVRCNFMGYEFYGAVDDIWVNEMNELFVVEYKSTASTEPVISLDKDYHKIYKRQVEIYQWILRNIGFKVSEIAYFVYCTGDKNRASFESLMHFNMNLIPYTGDTSWVEACLKELINCIESDIIPAVNTKCEYCNYYSARKEIQKEIS